MGNSPPGLVLEISVLKLCSKFTEEHPCRSVITIKFQTTLLKLHF